MRMKARDNAATKRAAQGLLLAAADRLERHGWRRGDLWHDSYILAPYVGGDPCCALGALAVAAGAIQYEQVSFALRNRPALALAVQALAGEIDAYGEGVDPARRVVQWNDDPGRTVDEVIAGMRSAAHQVESASVGSLIRLASRCAPHRDRSPLREAA